MEDELIDICDDSNNLTKIQKMKSEAHREGLWHKAAHIWIYNSQGEILFQLRAKEKSLYPDMWDVSVAGHVGAGEDPIISGLRELQEEIGLEVKQDDLQFFHIKKVKALYKNIKNNEFCYVYFLKFDGDIEKLELQDEEVQEIKFFSPDKIAEELKIHPDKYLPPEDYLFEVINEIKRKLAMRCSKNHNVEFQG